MSPYIVLHGSLTHILLIYIIVVNTVPLSCVYLNLRRTLAVIVLLVQMSNMMYVACVEGTGAHAHGARTPLKRT